VELWWPEEQRFFRGTVREYDVESGEHRVHYDDGEIEWVHLSMYKRIWRGVVSEATVR
jgi:hypothetical protein